MGKRSSSAGEDAMLIREMNAQECRDLLARLSTGRLGCARNNQPYIVPVYFAYEPDRLHGFSTVGQKIEWMPVFSRKPFFKRAQEWAVIRSTRKSDGAHGRDLTTVL
jgi:hypothetical protein